MKPVISAINQADKAMHSLAQFLAQTAMQKLPDQPDDSQTNLHWNNNTARLEGRPFSQNGRSVRLVIDTEKFALVFLTDDDQRVSAFPLDGKTPTQTQTWWQDQLRTWGVTEFRKLNYQLDSPPIDEQIPYTQPQGLAEWAQWRTVANETLLALNTSSGQTSEVRIWPHHFDTGIYYSFPDASGSERAAIWAGLAIADAICDEPYFYLSGYNHGQLIDFGQATALSVGEWINLADWKGALLPISGATDSTSIQSFLADSYQWVYKQLTSQHSKL